MAPPKKRPSRKTTRNPPDTDHPQMEPASVVDDSDSSPDTDHQNTEGRGRSLRKRKKVSYTYDDDSESAPDTDHSPMESTNDGDDSDSEHGQAHPHSDHMNDDEDSAHSNDTDHSNSDSEPTSDPEHHSAGQVDEDQLSPHSTQHSADEEEGEEYIFDAPPSPSPPPPRLILTYGDRVMEYIPTTPLPHMVGAPVTFAIFMQHGDGSLQRVEPMANPPPPPLVPVPPPPPPAEVEMWHPPKGTLKYVFDAIKTHLRWGDEPGETDAKLGESEEFVELMESLPVRGTHTLGLGTPRTTLIRNGDNNNIWIKWQGDEVKALMYSVQKDFIFSWHVSQKMCTVANCWLQAVDRVIGYCREDSTKLREVLLLRDANNVNPNIVLLHPILRMTPYDDDIINDYIRLVRMTIGYKTITNYIEQHPTYRFVIDMPWSFATTLSLEKFNTFAVATCIMTFLHNNAFRNSTLSKIRLRMSQITFKDANWNEVRKILETNGFKFIVIPATNQLAHDHMFPAHVIKNQDHTYQGDDGNGAVKDGILLSKIGGVLASGASKGNALPHMPLAGHLHSVVMLYQDILDPEEHDPEETETRTRHAEFMGILATLLGIILEQDFKGHPMRPMTEQLTHYDLVFDYNVFRRLFQFKTGCTIIVRREGNGIPIVNGKPQFVW
ncbi:hypothetical protein Fcan01_05062 [Folsomia candida]|uniref:Uncharacterized protein n=1 Tax=Folsomia candida TaxID=158441 RepID=A0A226ERA6_FOLCA|nr:hypothetical protein Fcan01_05062 [Folsomia candida]